jgi:hypothetical protein
LWRQGQARPDQVELQRWQQGGLLIQFLNEAQYQFPIQTEANVN